MTTKLLEEKIFKHLKGTGTYLCFEVKMPDSNERVDLLSLDTHGIWRFYELKVSKADFNSKSKVTFRGHYNYYVMPDTLYKEVANDIPKGIGVIVCTEMWGTCHSANHAERRELDVNDEELRKSFIQALSRETEKLVNFKAELRKINL